MPAPFQIVRQSLPRIFRRALLGLSTAAACVTGLSGCQAVNGTSTSTSQVRIIDASPDSGGLDIYANSSVLVYNLGFGTITSYIPTNPGTYTFSANTSGSRTAVTSVKQTIATSKQYTLLISNVAASLQSQFLVDASQPAPSGQIALRFLDEAVSAGAVDIYLVPSGSTLIKTNPVRTGLVFGTNTDYVYVPTGTYTLYVLSSGTVPSATTVALYTGASTTYNSGSARTVVILDQQIVTNPAIQVVTTSDYDTL